MSRVARYLLCTYVLQKQRVKYIAFRTTFLHILAFPMDSPSMYYGPHRTKQDYDCASNNARIWALENPEEHPTVAARIYHVREDSIRKSILRSKQKQRNSEGKYNTYGGNNKILNEAQEEAVRQYCYEPWEMGLGALHAMVFAAICHLRKVGLHIGHY